ncbi:uncharacterized protein ANIA_07819 [Aspergillus nidulans FGSC A4]|uniref:Uncharacterized protein n=1 Tax=Emericella nidulans (strain FGSC A4 / ATCC 38163 / CBS 112.46 / NRRL 194 / M139) TaxID=227321 RepID=C8VDU3_EMENI|nr:hypothetical protein [Aspergillus nidulans FGSC A4]CBF80173.1 TPA: conserved hypothetical protein [Aspergillus nidulans FGSC A4]
MATQPAGFLQQFALQASLCTQLLANLQWLCEFQVLACIPLDGEVAFEEVADISNVPVDQLQRVVRLMVTAGFLSERPSGHVAHTPLSASFVTEPELLDAALFLAQVAVPAALKMPRSTCQPDPYDRGLSPSLIARSESRATGLEDRPDPAQPKVQRQFAAYLARGILDEPLAVDEVLRLVDWGAIGPATIVDIHPPSTSTIGMIAALGPAAQLVIQTSSPGNGQSGPITGSEPSWVTYQLPPSISNRVSVHSRGAGAPQTVLGPAVYIVRIPSPSPMLPWTKLRSQTVMELQAHLQVLRTQPTSRLMIAALVLPSPGTVNQETESMVRLRDMSLLQLSNERQPTKTEIVEIVTGIRDSGGCLVVTREIHTTASAAIGLEVRYEPSARKH